MIILSTLFFVTAILYSSVGFGGGSTYLALLLIWEIPYFIFPVIALFCNILVVSGNSINYIKAGNFSLKLLIPFLVGSIPFAFIGGSVSIEKELFELILFFVLMIAGLLLLFQNKFFNQKNNQYKKLPIYISFIIGSILGLISGIVGIGGGIFLSPILFLLRAANPKKIATTASLFILTNSLAGLIGQLTKGYVIDKLTEYWPLLLIVSIGGQIGNFLNIKIFSNRPLIIITALLVLFVAARMGLKII